MNKLIVTKENEANEEYELPMYFKHLTKFDLKNADTKLESRVVESKFYSTSKHLLTYPHKLII